MATAPEALTELRRARRSRRASQVDVFDAFYQAYLLAIGVGAAVLLLSDAVGDRRLGVVELARVASRGPAMLGLAAAVVAAVGLRSGAHGGPLVLPAADVRYVLMAPVPRVRALRGPAMRHLRFAGFVGLVAGAMLGVQAARRMPGGLLPWVATGAAAAALIALGAVGSALIFSGRRLGPLPGWAVSVLLIGWSVADILAHTRTSPATLVGVVALWPLRFSALGIAAAVVPVLMVAGALGWVGGSSLEAADRRASLASQIRFALTLQDLRTVVLLRRQLAQEHPRSRPWVRARSLAKGHLLVWRRDMHGIARWPVARVLRVLMLGVIAGVSLVGFWAGTTPLIGVAALALFLAGLDAGEPLAAEIDHPDRGGSMPVELGRLRVAHVPASAVMVSAAVLAGWGAAFAIGPARIVAPVGAALLVPAVLLATAGAAVSVVMGPPAAPSFALPVEVAGARLVYRALWPPALVLVGLTPVLAARSSALRGLAPGPATLAAASTPLLVGMLAIAWLRFREQVHEWLKGATQPPVAARS